MDILFMSCAEVLAGWAVGGQSLIYPDVAGFPLGGPDDKVYYMLQIHYDNPQSRSGQRSGLPDGYRFELSRGVVDKSGFRLHTTTNLRKYDIGIVWTGVKVGEFLVLPPNVPSFKTYAYCDTSPVNKQVGKNYTDMQIFGSILHTHLAGSEIRVLQFRLQAAWCVCGFGYGWKGLQTD
ncbi:DBH-like monooxygenase protein 2 homolog [Mustelus asterias]